MIEEFYKENYKIVYGYLCALCSDSQLAEELTAEVFCKAIERIGQYDPRYKASTWLCAIGKNLYYSECRRRKKLKDWEHREVVIPESIERIVLDRDQASRILACLDFCGELQKQVFLMRLEGLNFREIGVGLGKTENWARVTYYRTKNRIREEMEGEE